MLHNIGAGDFLFFFRVLIYLKGQATERETDRDLHPQVLSQMATLIEVASDQSQGPGTPSGSPKWQGSQHFGHVLPLPRYIFREWELNWKWSSHDSNG